MKLCFKNVVFPATRMQLPVAPAAAAQEEPIRIWLVDDDTRLASVMAELLNKFEGLECSRIFSATRPLLQALSSEPPPHVILLDVNLGREDGIQAVPEIKAAALRARILIMSTFYDRCHEARALQAGATEFLTKHEVERMVQAIRRARAGAPPVSTLARPAARSVCN